MMSRTKSSQMTVPAIAVTIGVVLGFAASELRRRDWAGAVAAENATQTAADPRPAHHSAAKPKKVRRFGSAIGVKPEGK